MTENDVNPLINYDPMEKRNEFIDHTSYMGHTLAIGTGQFPQTYKHFALPLPAAESSRSILIEMLITP